MRVLESVHRSLWCFVLSAPCAIAWAGGAGDHVRVGELTLTPSLYAGFEYHSNIYLEDSDVNGAPSFVVSPRLQASADRPDWSLAASAGYLARKYVDLDPKDAVQEQNLDRFNNVDANLSLNVFKRSIVGARVDDRFTISNVPAELETSSQNANIRVISNDLSGGLLLRPGSALEFGLLGALGVDDYKVPEAFSEETSVVNFNGRQSYGPMLDARWKFLPKTALFGGGGVTWNRWRNNIIRAAGPEAEGLDYGQYLGKPDSIAWRTLWGVKGQFTTKLSAELGLGYGQAWYDENSVLESELAGTIPNAGEELALDGVDDNAENFARDLKSFGEGFLIRGQIGWVPRQGHTINLGYKKDFQDAFFTNYAVTNYVYAKYEGTFVDRITLGIEAGVRADGYHGEVSRHDLNLLGNVSGAYGITRFLKVNAAVGYNGRTCGDPGCADGVFAPTQFDDFYGNLGLTLLY